MSSADHTTGVLVVSPHLDDAVLSCGGLLHRARAQGVCARVVTVFAGEPRPDDVGPLANWFHELCGHGMNTVAVRRAEDRAAGDRLGFEAVHLDFLDCAYRRAGRHHLYPSEASVFGPVVADDLALIEELAERIGSMDAGLVLAPLAIGGHVDHVIAREAAARAFGGELLLFEDVPYAFEPELLAAATAGRARWSVPIDGDAKRAAVECYTSQLEMLWRGPASLWDELDDLGVVGGRSPTERFWTTRSDPLRRRVEGGPTAEPARWSVDRGPLETRFGADPGPRPRTDRDE